MGRSAPPYLHRFRLGSRRSLITHAPLLPGFRDAAPSDDSRASLPRLPGRGCTRRRREPCAPRHLSRAVGQLHGGGRRRPGEPIKMERRGRMAKTPTGQTHQSPVSKRERKPSMFEKESVSGDRRPKTAFPPFR